MEISSDLGEFELQTESDQNPQHYENKNPVSKKSLLTLNGCVVATCKNKISNIMTAYLQEHLQVTNTHCVIAGQAVRFRFIKQLLQELCTKGKLDVKEQDKFITAMKIQKRDVIKNKEKH